MPDTEPVVARFRVDLGDSLAQIGEFKSAIASVGEGGGGGGGLSALEDHAQKTADAFAGVASKSEVLTRSASGMNDAVLSTAEAFGTTGEAIAAVQDRVERSTSAFTDMGGTMSDVTDRYIEAHKASDGFVASLSGFDEGKWRQQMSDIGLETWDFNTALEKTGETAKSGGIASLLNADLAPGIGGFITGLSNSLMGIGGLFWMTSMIGPAISGIGKSLYDAAAIAEGPAAHSFSTFTGQIDIMNAHADKANQIFSEAFGQSVLPVLTQFNQAQASGGFDFNLWLGSTLGRMLVGNPWQAASNLFNYPVSQPPFVGPTQMVPPVTVTGMYGHGNQPFTFGETLHIETVHATTGTITIEGQSPMQQFMQTPFMQGIGGFFGGIGSFFSNLFSQPSSMQQWQAQQSPGVGQVAGIGIPSINLSGIGASISSALSGALSSLSNINIPIPNIDFSGIAGSISSALSTGLSSIGKLSGLSIPNIDFGGIASSIGAAINSAISNLMRNITGGAIPSFASGVENFSGGLAYVHKDELLMLPQGSSVYPTSVGSGVPATSLAGIGGSGGYQSANIVVQVDSQAILSAVGVPLQQTIRLMTGRRQ